MLRPPLALMPNGPALYWKRQYDQLRARLVKIQSEVARLQQKCDDLQKKLRWRIEERDAWCTSALAFKKERDATTRKAEALQEEVRRLNKIINGMNTFEWKGGVEAPAQPRADDVERARELWRRLVETAEDGYDDSAPGLLTTALAAARARGRAERDQE